MSDAWDDAEKAADEHSGSDKFVQLKNDGDKVVGAFLGDPHTRELFYNKKEEKYEDFTEEHRKAGKTPSLRVSLNMLVTAEGNGENMNKVDPPKVKIIEGGVKWFKAVLKNKKKYGLDKKYFEVERSGAKGDTKTTYTVLPDDSISDEDRKAMRELDLHDLTEAAGQNDQSPGDDDFDSYNKSKGGSPDDPIDESEADELMASLRKRPREDIDKFLSKFGVKRIKTLKKKDLADAKKFVASLTDDGGGDDEEEADPFA